ncbi:probable LRR receptor-like serine/threonine-protein kinase At1g06840 isoform X1 [Ziziphus jujuba]|uniref:non-specific serine/threonine protein kinase n=1 Tax=Ziziphus jujuba TaxID=326968 RepID=A0A6P4B6P8_ZIZJJ|nr:probable LRR receptor-like serine/threonine-protein kinase At1g06840 isoform X1 [Ziziphus jujuba]
MDDDNHASCYVVLKLTSNIPLTWRGVVFSTFKLRLSYPNCSSTGCPVERFLTWCQNAQAESLCTCSCSVIFLLHASRTCTNYRSFRSRLLNMNLSGSLVPELGQLSQLQILDFMWNELTGTIPKEIGKIASLILLLLNGNNLSGSLPDELGYLSKLNRFQIDQNQLSGPIPRSFANLLSVKHLHFNNNSLSGEIPSEFSKLSNLLHMLLDNNNLSGSLPPELSNLSDLRILQLDNNNFRGSEIPATYGKLSTLAKLSLKNCSLQGGIPDFSGIANLSYLDLSRNHLTGTIPSQKLSHNMTTIKLSHNNLNGSIPMSFSDLPFLQKLSLESNLLTGTVPANLWQNLSLTKSNRRTLDLRNNSLSNILGDLDPPANVTLRLDNNPICKNSTMQNIGRFCSYEAGGNEIPENSTNSTQTMTCPPQACPDDNYFEYVPASPVPCFCASPLRIGYRLKSPSFSYFLPYMSQFKMYLSTYLNLDISQISIDSFIWEEGPRLRMNLKLFPLYDKSTFNTSEVQRIRNQFTSWRFPRTDFFGPYELLNFTLQGPYSTMSVKVQRASISKGILAAIIIGAIAIIVSIAALVMLLITRRSGFHHTPSSRKNMSTRISVKIDDVRSFTIKEMALATGNFSSSSQVGQGGYGKVYKGILPDNMIVAIKRAEEGSLQGQREFLTEIELLSRVHHRNLVSLVGYCDEEDEQMLVYEFMPNGTLRDWLGAKAKRTLSFGMRLRIALGSAKAILYLHTEADPPIFHRDIKASNILLDSNLIAKVADFGLSRLAPLQDDEGTPKYVSTIVKGTPGYLDPEYFLTHKLTDKSDVYSLGVVFLELLTGMQPILHGKNIVREVNVAHESGNMFSIIDSRMGSYPSDCVERFVGLALSCCHDKPEKRPSMLDVVRELENILKTMPESTHHHHATISESSAPAFSGKLEPSSSSSSYVTHDTFMSSSISGSDLVSGVIPSITPR